MYSYKINEVELTHCNTTKDLGVIVDRHLSLVENITTVIAQALKSYGFIIRNCNSFTSILELKVLYFTYVRSKREYTSIVCSPIYECNEIAIERVQRKF